MVSVRTPAGVAGLAPVWLLVPALLAGFVAPLGPATLAAWLLGLTLDLLSLEPLGLHAFLFAGAAWTIGRLRESVFSDHPATRAVMAGSAALLVLLVMLLRIASVAPGFSVGARLPGAILSASLTGALVPLLGLADSRLGIFAAPGRRRRRV